MLRTWRGSRSLVTLESTQCFADLLWVMTFLTRTPKSGVCDQIRLQVTYIFVSTWPLPSWNDWVFELMLFNNVKMVFTKQYMYRASWQLPNLRAFYVLEIFLLLLNPTLIVWNYVSSCWFVNCVPQCLVLVFKEYKAKI